MSWHFLYFAVSTSRIDLPKGRSHHTVVDDDSWDLPKPKTNYVYNGLEF
jgi:hypothetical protein